ncbi:MAG: hypothetical protein E7033_00485 [Akkermansiaceae bacterium]|nr:hypothetical protein [Akkermansiaceae bacterium]
MKHRPAAPPFSSKTSGFVACGLLPSLLQSGHMQNHHAPNTRTYPRAAAVLLCAALAAWGLGWSAVRIATEGVGVLGVNNNVPWGWDIVLFVFWIGLGHAGTLISAILLLTGKRWRKSIARRAELMTLCAICTAAVFPLIHVGRAWMLWQMVPLPVASGVWPEAASALVWDAAAICSYLLLSVLFLHMGIRGERADQANHRGLWAYSCLLMAGILTPLVITVHSVVGSDFALALRWQSVIIPPYFVCGALLSGMAAVQLIAVAQHCKTALLLKLTQLTAGLSGAIGLFYAYELITEPEVRTTTYGGMVCLNVILPIVLLNIRRLRGNRLIITLVSIGILIGMWQERVHIIIERSLHATGGLYSPSNVDIAMLAGSIGLFCALFIGFCTKLPQEQQNPQDHLPATPPRTVRHAALVGAGTAASLLLLWLYLTQQADTAGSAGSSPAGLPFAFPLLFVAILLGAGLGVYIHYISRTSR